MRSMAIGLLAVLGPVGSVQQRRVWWEPAGIRPPVPSRSGRVSPGTARAVRRPTPWTARRGRTVVAACVLGALVSCSSEAEPEPSSSNPQAEASSPSATASERSDVEVLVADAARAPVRGNIATGTYALVRAGEEAFAATSGVANRRTDEEFTARHRYVAVSISQVAVAVTVLRLMADGRLDPQDQVAKFLPGLLRNGDRITLEQLLTHSSGLRNYVDAPGTWPLLDTTPARPALLVQRADALRPAFAPGADAEYSATNAMVLGMVVEEVTGQALAAALHRWVFAPAGMSDSSLGWGSRSGAPVAHGYAEGRDVTGSPAVDWVWASGGVVSTSRDVSRFHDALFGGELLPAPWLDRMTTTQTKENSDLAYGYGLALLQVSCGGAWGDWGGIAGYTSHAWTRDDGERQVTLAVNTTSPSMTFGLAFEVADRALCTD